jgi:cytochrome c oxidase subunit I
MEGMSRRLYDGGVTYAASGAAVGLSPWVIHLNRNISLAAWSLGVAQIPFIINFFWSINNGKKALTDNPWSATTLEWQTPTPPPHGNFDKPVEVFRGPYEYSVPGHVSDYTPQNEPEKSGSTHGNPLRS